MYIYIYLCVCACVCLILCPIKEKHARRTSKRPAHPTAQGVWTFARNSATHPKPLRPLGRLEPQWWTCDVNGLNMLKMLNMLNMLKWFEMHLGPLRQRQTTLLHRKTTGSASERIVWLRGHRLHAVGCWCFQRIWESEAERPNVSEIQSILPDLALNWWPLSRRALPCLLHIIKVVTRTGCDP